MALKGQGGPEDTASGVGWLEAAVGNGCQQLVGNRLQGLRASLSPAQTDAAAQIVARYGPDTLRAEGVIDPQLNCPGTTPVGVASAVEPEYPPGAQAQSAALVIASMAIGVDGLARDPEILLAVPDESFAATAVEAWLNTRFVPAMRAGHPVAARAQLKQMFAPAGAQPVSELDTFRKARSAADSGDAAGSYRLGLAAKLRQVVRHFRAAGHADAARRGARR